MAQRKKKPAREAVTRPRGEQLTIGDVFSFVAPSLYASGEAPRWPPDAFAMAACVLKKSDAYAQAARTGAVAGRPKWRRDMAAIGREWRLAAASGAEPPKAVVDRWAAIWKERAAPLSALPRSLATALLDLCTAADEASEYAGLPPEGSSDVFAAECVRLLFSRERRSLCRDVDPSRAVVLPKLHTPQVGLTMRSITHHLALWDSGEVQPDWAWIPGPRFEEPKLNILFLPWPRRIWPSQIQPARIAAADTGAEHGYFTCASTLPWAGLAAEVEKLVHDASTKVGRIDLVLFPELALSAGLTARLCNHLEQKFGTGTIVVAGEGTAARGIQLGTNNAVVSVPGSPYIGQWQQAKHHRWKIDGSQIRTYGLGSQLDPTLNWWENIEVPSRKLRFCSLNQWLTLSVLVCEDLARQEPVGELLRTVGPTLVIALLMDGPQLETRWSARYASVLAEDPGSSVLSVTSLGMAELSQVPGKPPSRVVALWKEAGRAPVELSLRSDAAGLVLSLTRDKQRELTADGRTQGKQTGYLRLHGALPV